MKKYKKIVKKLSKSDLDEWGYCSNFKKLYKLIQKSKKLTDNVKMGTVKPIYYDDTYESDYHKVAFIRGAIKKYENKVDPSEILNYINELIEK